MTVIGPDGGFSLAPGSSEPQADPAPPGSWLRRLTRGKAKQKQKQECQGLQKI